MTHLVTRGAGTTIGLGTASVTLPSATSVAATPSEGCRPMMIGGRTSGRRSGTTRAGTMGDLLRATRSASTPTAATGIGGIQRAEEVGGTLRVARGRGRPSRAGHRRAGHRRAGHLRGATRHPRHGAARLGRLGVTRRRGTRQGARSHIVRSHPGAATRPPTRSTAAPGTAAAAAAALAEAAAAVAAARAQTGRRRRLQSGCWVPCGRRRPGAPRTAARVAAGAATTREAAGSERRPMR